MASSENVLEIRDLVKEFPGVRAVDNVSFDIKRNTVHCLVGENGAGKSTLIKILTGAYDRTSGSTLLNGKEYVPHDPKDAREQGVTTLYQELNVVDELTVEDNLTLGLEDTTFWFIRKTDKINDMIAVMNSIEPSIHPQQKVGSLSVAQKQIVEISKAAATESDVIIMDEPTSALSETEVQTLFSVMRELQRTGIGIDTLLVDVVQLPDE